ncbi:MAG: alpha-hydroxy-acid oxidizing protein [Rhodobacteraceae bacterium]|nr:alpha-hydroxy-acid oxidizing protein [Paracoccaceae bacterium]
MNLDNRFPALSDLKARAKRRIPHFAWEYLDSGTGDESPHRRNRQALDRVLFTPKVLRGEVKPDLSVRLMGRDYPLPFGISPVGMSGLFWPDAERRLARFAAKTGIPYGLSTVASQDPEALAPHIGDQGWFQLYPPRSPEIRTNTLNRARDAGFHTLILTVDAPVASRRERQTRGGVTHPPRLTPRVLSHVMMRPAWALGTLRVGMPRLRLIESYNDLRGSLPSTEHIGHMIRTAPDWQYLKELREEWKGSLVVKGVLDTEDAVRIRDEGADAVWVSNHAGRQFAGQPASISVLPAIRAAVGPDYPIIFDSGIEGGLDIMRAYALGADFVMLARAWHHGLAAFGDRGVEHVAHILKADLIANLGQLGVGRLTDLADSLTTPPDTNPGQ